MTTLTVSPTTTPSHEPEPPRAATASRRTTLGPAWHERVEGLHVLRVAGSFFDMGYQHGALLRRWIPDGPLTYYRSYVDKLLGSRLGSLAPLVRRLLQATVGRRVARAIPPFARQALRGLAEGSGLPYAAVLEGATMPDTLLWLVARLIDLGRVEPAVRHRMALSLGCTSAIAWGAATRDGRLLHGRNFDYHGVGCWPRSQAVIFHAPERGQRYVSVAAAGIPLGGATAMNEAGLTLTVHQHMFSNGTRLGGTAIGTVGDIVMREAENLDDAEAILRRHRAIGCWTYLICDGKTNELLCFEENPDRQVAIRPAPDSHTFAYSNIYLDPQLGATERNLYPSYWRHNQGRYERAHARLAERFGEHDPGSIAGVLADTGSDECRIRHAIAMLMTVASVVFEPETRTVWVASGEAPTSHRPFIPFSLETESYAPERGRLTEHIPADRDALAAFDAYREGYLALVDGGDAGAALAALRRACALQPEQPLYHKVAGLLAIRTGAYEAAERSLARALELGHPDPERVETFRLWHGRALDLLGRREAALADYRRVLEAQAVDPAVRAAARRGLRRRYTPRRARRVPIEFAKADVVRP